MSQSKICLPKEDVECLRCVKCANYLSVSPIVISAEGYECGRCVVPNCKKTKNLRATAYERLAKFMIFPCKFDTLGCENLLNFDDTNHEGNCKYRTIECPAIQCKATIGMQEILEHFKKKHPQLLIKSNQIEFSNEDDVFENKIITFSQHLFLLKTASVTVDKNKQFKLGLSSFRESKISSYRLEIKSKKNSNLFVLDEQKIFQYQPGMKYTTDQLTFIDLNTMAIILKSPKIFFEIKLGEENEKVKLPNKGCDDSILDHLECVVCKEYMTPPIFICKTGHSVCSNCKNELTSCPTCKSSFEGARNFTLEKMAEDLELVEENRTAACSNSKVASNQSKSGSKFVDCYLAEEVNCRWQGHLNKLRNHLSKAHPLSVRASLNATMYQKFHSNDYFWYYYIITFDEIDFKLAISHNNKITAGYWYMEQIGLAANSKPQYQFIVEFVDKNQTQITLIASEFCYPPKNKGKVLKICHEVLNPFFVNDKLFFKINLKKINSA